MILERLGKELLFFDGGMGTLLQAKGLLRRIAGDLESDACRGSASDSPQLF